MIDRLGDIDRAAGVLLDLCGGEVPKALLVLGSGLSAAVEGFPQRAVLPFAELPGYAASGIVGHPGRFIVVDDGAGIVLAMFGRLHLYEGHSADRIVLPVRAAARLSCRTLVLTNASGGLAEDLGAGSLVLIRDHINMMGSNPLVGPNLDEIGERFPEMTEAYDLGLREIARQVAEAQQVDLAEGVYAGVLGPSYETPAEAEMLRRMGADVVGMSTVPEAIAGHHAGMRVLGLSFVANRSGAPALGHEAVLAAVGEGSGRLASMLAAILGRL